VSSDTFPTVRKTSRYVIHCSHDLKGVTAHADAMNGEHWHEWEIAIISTKPYSPKLGFGRDEADIDKAWGARIEELHDKNLSELMKLPATAENLACWLLFYWLPRLSDQEVNFELNAVRVTKDHHTAEVERTERNKAAWKAFGGEAA
jgi:hypothetical protein